MAARAALAGKLRRCNRQPSFYGVLVNLDILALLGNTACVSRLTGGLLYPGKQSSLSIFHKRFKLVGPEKRRINRI
jgi:hypothetical protein